MILYLQSVEIINYDSNVVTRQNFRALMPGSRVLQLHGWYYKRKTEHVNGHSAHLDYFVSLYNGNTSGSMSSPVILQTVTKLASRKLDQLTA